MSSVRGKLIVIMQYEVPVNGDQYKQTLRDKGEVTGADIVDAEEQNYLDNLDTYVEALAEHIASVSFEFNPGRENDGTRSG
jgi:hypothetical protein